MTSHWALEALETYKGKMGEQTRYCSDDLHPKLPILVAVYDGQIRNVTSDGNVRSSFSNGVLRSGSKYDQPGL